MSFSVSDVELMTSCIESCKVKACSKDTDTKKGCNQMYSCSHGCKMRQLGVDKKTCEKNCQRKGSSGCSPKVNGFKFSLCTSCNREGCSKWPEIAECETGCRSFVGNYVLLYTLSQTHKAINI